LTTGGHSKLSGHICIEKLHFCRLTIETKGCIPVPAMHNYYTTAVAILTNKQWCCLMYNTFITYGIKPTEEHLPGIMWCCEPFLEELIEIEAFNDIRN